jgi:2-polyprenyl-3-methyl-5-hydroxy-6-metoxy-1,4-benzoquinol methylase
MEKLSSCPVCGNPGFSSFLQGNDYFLSGEEFSIMVCESCGMKFINPRPDSGEISRYYESPEYVSHDAARKSLLNIIYRIVRKSSIRRKYKLVKSYAKGNRLLDIGCGTGEFISFCQENGFVVTGIEPGEKPRTFARTKYKLNVHEDSFLETLVKPEFDIITLWHVLEHVHQLHERMQKIYEILKPDGTIIIAVPNCDSWDAAYYGKFWAAYDLPRHLYHFSQSTVEILAQSHGLKLEEIIPMKRDAFYISLLSEKYAKGKQDYLRAVLNGTRSNNFAKNNKNNYSSLIYVFKR